MLATIVQTAFVIFFLVPAGAAAGYYFGLMVARILGASARCREFGTGARKFAIVIPAHNEQAVIESTIRSCQDIDYPLENFQVFVLADNCSDSTAEIGNRLGAICLVRNDPQNPGKGQAMQWALPQVLGTDCEAVVFVDADCRIDKDALKVFEHCIDSGNQVLQANYVTSNPDAGPISYLARIGNVTEYDLFYAPKSDLGLSVNLAGSGMVFHRSVLERCPWTASSVTEDVEYALTLTRAGIPIRFVSNVAVRQAAAVRIDQMQAQRTRWASGNLALGRRQALPLIAEGIRRRNRRLADFGWTLAVLSRPLVLMHLLLTLIFGALLGVLINSTVAWILFGASVVILGMQVVYFAVGILAVGVTPHRLKLLCSTPAVGFRLARIAAAGFFAGKDLEWERTPR